MDLLAEWTHTLETFTGPSRDGRDGEPESRWVHSMGEGPGVILIHEFPGIEAGLVRYAREIVDRGYTVWLPQLFGTPGGGLTLPNIVGDIRQFCVRREFSVFAQGKTSDIATWLRALANKLHDQAGGVGVGVIGMCFTGGFALAMMTEAAVIAPVMAEPSLPAPMGMPRAAARRGADLGLSPDDARAVKSREVEVLGLRYRTDPATGTQCPPVRREFGDRFGSLRRLLGDRFLAVEFEGKGHSVLTGQRRDYGVERVNAFLDLKLRGVAELPPVRDRDLERRVTDALPPGFEVRVTRDPLRVVLFVERGLTTSALPRIEAVVRDVAGVEPEVVKVSGLLPPG